VSNGAPLRLVATTVRSEDDARRLAATLIGRRLIACATMAPVVSMYRWQGMVEFESEVQVVFKTTDALVEDVAGAIEELHTYDLPEILKFGVEATEQYAAWVGAETSA
jgi:periplasmic divalent cation tolerance protein